MLFIGLLHTSPRARGLSREPGCWSVCLSCMSWRQQNGLSCQSKCPLRGYSTHMDRNEILEYLNAEITRLTAVRDLMSGQETEPRRRGRPKEAASRAISFNPEEFAPQKRRTMSP